MKIPIALLVLVVCAQSTKLPNNFKKCNRKDPNVDKCVLEAAQNALPQLTKTFPHINLANLSPMEIKELNIGAGSQGVVNVQQNFKNCKLYGLNDLQLSDFGFNFNEKYIHGSGVISDIRKICHYDLNGKVLLLPIVGTGQSTIELKHVNVSARMDFEEVKKDGKTYFHFINPKLSLDPVSISFNFENLFNGNKELGDNINKVLNDNNKEVYADVRQGYEDGIGLVIAGIFNNLFSKVSIEEACD